MARGSHKAKGRNQARLEQVRLHRDPVKDLAPLPKVRPNGWLGKIHLSRLDQNNRTPQSILTVREFVKHNFIPDHVDYKKLGGKEHYASQLPFVLDGVPDKKLSRGGKTKFKPGEEAPPVVRKFGLGEMRLRDVRRDDVQRLVKTMLSRGHSTQSAKHVKTAVSAIYTNRLTG